MADKKCSNCDHKFSISKDEKAFLNKLDLSEPKLCPVCRSQRRWAVRNQSKLYKRKCDFTNEVMVSLYAPDSKHIVYSEDVWWSDKWDPMDSGREYDFKKNFFDQFRQLQLQVPRRGMHQDGTNENCQFTTFGMNNKNCYLAFGCFACENTYYSTWSVMSRETSDCLLAINSELLYECIHCEKCYKSAYCQDCNECTECFLMEDCSNCQNCIGCKNVSNKQYYIYNKPSSKKKYEALKVKLEKSGFEDELIKYNQWKMDLPNRFAHIIASQDCDGDYIYNSKNCHNCFGILIQGAEDCWHCHMSGAQAKEMVDCAMSGQGSEQIYEMQAVSGVYHGAFVNFCRFSKYVYYCDSVSNCEYCFGCVGLKNKKYCILNKQYSKEEYTKSVAKIIEHMQKSGEWGENFPIQYSPFPYNDTLAQDFFPLTKRVATNKGYQWKDVEVLKVIKQTTRVDKDIEQVGREVLRAVLFCKECGKNYKIIPQEYRLYKVLKVSVPERCPDCRHTRRMDKRKANKLFHRQCMCEELGHDHEGRCKNEFKTTYTPDRPEKVYCESCYQKSII